MCMGTTNDPAVIYPGDATKPNPTERHPGNKTTGASKGRPDTPSALQSDWIHSSDIICGSRSGSLGVAVSYLWNGIRSI